MQVAQQLIGQIFKDYSRERSLMSLFSWIVVLLQVRYPEAETPSWKLLQPVALKASPAAWGAFVHNLLNRSPSRLG
jgi:hypothetical protein